MFSGILSGNVITPPRGNATVAHMSEQDIALLKSVYEMLKIARLSSMYYERRLWTANLVHFTFEIMIAVGATTSGVAAWALWQNKIYASVWAVIAGASTLFAILKPILAPAKWIELCTRQHQGWFALYFALDKLRILIRQDAAFTRETRRRVETLYDRLAAISLDDEKCPSERLIKQLEPKVAAAIPDGSLWLPNTNPPQIDNVKSQSTGIAEEVERHA